MHADGSNVRELSPDPFNSSGIAWSRDGEWVAAHQIHRGLVLINAVTAAYGTVIVPPSTGTAVLPDFSPDGKELAYTLEDDQGSVDIYVSATDGSNPRRLTYSTGFPNIHVGPKWSPDGTLLAFWGLARDTILHLPDRVVPAVFQMTTTGISIPWKSDPTVYGDQPFWRPARR
jgi:TolB protein